MTYISDSEADVLKKGLEIIDKSGGFLAKHLDGPFTQISGLISDNIKIRRYRNIIDFHNKYGPQISQHNIPEIGFKESSQIIDSISLEEDKYLQKLWANLICSTTSEDKMSLLTHINILKQLNSLEAKLLNTIYNWYFTPTCIKERSFKVPKDTPLEDVRKSVPFVFYSPTTYDGDNRNQHIDFIKNINSSLQETNSAIQFALDNLQRLGCIQYATGIGGWALIDYINYTQVGISLYRATQYNPLS